MSQFIYDPKGQIAYTPPKFHPTARNPTYRTMAGSCDSGVTSVNSAAGTDSTLRNRVLSCDLLSFVTGAACQSVQLAHVCNADRDDAIRKAEVEDVLTAMRFNGDDLFKLDSEQNTLLLEAGLHIPWESNGAFVLVPDTALLQKLLDALVACNVAWQTACADGVPKPRTGSADPFPVAQMLRQDMTWRLITLRPATLLLHNRPLTILSFEARQKIVEQPTTYVPPRTEWHSWYLHPYLPVLVPEDSEDIADELRLPDHPHRPPNERVSLFAMLLNAHTKLAHYMRSPEVGTAYLAYRRKSGMANATPDYLIKQYAMLIGLIVDELFFKPEVYGWPLKGIGRSTRPGSDGGGGPGGGDARGDGGEFGEGDRHDGHDEDTGGASDKHRQAADDDSRVRRSRRATQSEEALVPCSPVDSAPPSGVLSSLTSGLAKCHIASPPFSGVDDSEARYGDWLLAEADNTLAEDGSHHDAGSGKPSDTHIVQDTEQPAKSPFDSPDDPATAPEEEIDGFTETEWLVLKAQLNGRDRALAQSAAIMMICKTDYQEPVGFC